MHVSAWPWYDMNHVQLLLGDNCQQLTLMPGGQT
jgi:hypothetical protein